LARLVAYLLEIVALLERKSEALKTLCMEIDTSTPTPPSAS